MSDTQRYQAQADMRGPGGERFTVDGDGLGGGSESASQVLDGFEAAVRAQHPGATVEASRIRRAN